MMKLKFLIFFSLFAKITFAQISKGEISFEILDSISFVSKDNYKYRKHFIEICIFPEKPLFLDKF